MTFDMSNICAVIDVQGFNFKDRFVPREIAIVSDELSQCQELNPRMNWRTLSDDDKGVVLHSTKFIHGLHYCPFNPVEHAFLYTSDEINKIINQWYVMIASEEKPLFAYKNQQMGRILTSLNIPCISLDQPNLMFPSYREIQAKYGDNYLCSYHKKPPRGANNKLICAYRKANHLYRQLKELIGESPKIVTPMDRE